MKLTQDTAMFCTDTGFTKQTLLTAVSHEIWPKF